MSELNLPMPLWLRVLRMLCGAVLIVSGFIKLLAPVTFLKAVYGYELLSPAAGLAAAAVLPWLELVLGLCLLLDLWPVAAALWTLLLGVVFVLVQASALHRNLNIACGCFGGSASVGVGSVARSLLLTLAAMAVLVGLIVRGK